jgi:hypothetical protein
MSAQLHVDEHSVRALDRRLNRRIRVLLKWSARYSPASRRARRLVWCWRAVNVTR